eukprot:3072566-Pyramimonas_sp.AAC.1
MPATRPRCAHRMRQEGTYNRTRGILYAFRRIDISKGRFAIGSTNTQRRRSARWLATEGNLRAVWGDAGVRQVFNSAAEKRSELEAAQRQLAEAQRQLGV